MDLQSRIAEQSLYVGSRFSCHNGTLNATITKGNLGLLALATGDPSMGITAFEAALRVSHTDCLLKLLDSLVSSRLILCSCSSSRTNNYCYVTRILLFSPLSSIFQLRIRLAGTKKRQSRYEMVPSWIFKRRRSTLTHTFPRQLLRRMLHMQIDVYGPDNDICVATGEKISNLLNDYADGTSHQNVHSSHTHSAQQSTKFRPFSLMRRRHSKLS